MAKTKGTDVIGLRKIFQERGPDLEQAFLQRLTPELQKLYRTIMATSWTPVDQQTELYAAAAAVLFPGSPEPMRQFGRLVAQRTFAGIYKIFLRLPKVEFVMKRVADVWNSYYDTGEAAIENFTGHTGDFVVRKFPDLPGPMREVACGHIGVILELTGAKRVSVRMIDRDPNAWRWQIVWE